MATREAMKLGRRNVLVTGASQGLGRTIVEQLCEEGANVLFCSRREKQLLATYDELKRRCAPAQKLIAQVCDVSDAKDVARLFSRLNREFRSLYAVINNAGVQKPIGLTENVDWKAWRRTVEVNLFGTVLICRRVVPILKRAGSGKIVNLAGGGATAPRARFSAYAASKAAVVRFTETLAEELIDYHIDVNAVAPGPLNTSMLEEILKAGADQAGARGHAAALLQKAEGGFPVEKAARLCVYLASPASDGITGRLISARWDPWTTLQDHREFLQTSDVYTLRRILPSDRGQNW
jgi:NAD(P)-dependent dehydrogenase (short-subunit alcohol dehydrogenase family)